MVGITDWMTSPSVRSTRRSTPCVLGCCGPMLTSISSVRTSNSTTRGSSRVRGMAVVSGQLFSTDSVILQRHFVVFAQRMAFPVFGTENAIEIGMAEKTHAGKVEDL